MEAQKPLVGLPDLADAERPVYANVAHVSWTPYDFRITFSLLMTPHDETRFRLAEAAMVPHGVAEVVMPAQAVESLAELLRSELKEFADRFGAPQPQLHHSAQS